MQLVAFCCLLIKRWNSFLKRFNTLLSSSRYTEGGKLLIELMRIEVNNHNIVINNYILSQNRGEQKRSIENSFVQIYFT